MSTTPHTHPVITRHDWRVFAWDLGFFALLVVLPFLAHAVVKALPLHRPHTGTTVSALVAEGPVLTHDVGPPVHAGPHHGHHAATDRS